ncbi:acyl-CoA N-acyltransferases (NAT) superfamily protein [Tasmannia lanceolata]|uniref:acyl-CoA N-acyltransferases (NAT) superfamily protein n=1 Tax=Tasmannia lanceolata TaxID=3420 RepID=UPI0040640E6C
MAHLKAYPNPISSKKLSKNSSLRNKSTTIESASAKYRGVCLNSRRKCEIWGNERWVSLIFLKNDGKRRYMEKRRLVCCSTSTEEVGLVGKGEKGKYGAGEGQFGNLVSEFGWRVRRLVEDEDEMRRVAQVQAEAFHVPMPLFNDLFFQFFEAEVLAGLIYKLRNSPPNRYACLVAEPTDASASLQKSQRGLVGVVDVTVLRDEAVLKHLDGVEEYLYVSGIAVLRDFRRKKVATVLLKACDLLSLLWGFDYLALRAYEDDSAALRLYSNAGYKVVSGDPRWMTTWIGRKRRVLMIKQSALRDWC